MENLEYLTYIVYEQRKKINPEKPGEHLSLCSDAGMFKAAGYHGNKNVVCFSALNLLVHILHYLLLFSLLNNLQVQGQVEFI